METTTAKKIIEILSVINPDVMEDICIYRNHLRLLNYVNQKYIHSSFE